MRFTLIFSVIAIAFSVLTVSCSDHETVVQKRCVNQMSVYPDSSFVGTIKNLQFHEGHLYLLDINRRSVLSLDGDLSTLQSVSRGGRSKEELLNPFSFTVSVDSVFVIDFGGFKMKTFHKGQFVDEKPIPVCARDQRFFKDGDTFFLPYRDPETSVVKTTYEGSPVTVLPAEPFFSQVKTMTMNSCQVLSYSENLVVVPEALPWVKIVSKDGEIIRSIDLAQSDAYRRNVSYAHKADGEEKSFYVLNVDACIVGDILLILVPTYGDHYTCNQIVSVSLSTGEMADAVMSLTGEVYSTFCSDGKMLYAFNHSENQIEVYEM